LAHFLVRGETKKPSLTTRIPMSAFITMISRNSSICRFASKKCRGTRTTTTMFTCISPRTGDYPTTCDDVSAARENRFVFLDVCLIIGYIIYFAQS